MSSLITLVAWNSVYSALAALGFAILFNVPKHYLPYTLLLAAIGHDLRLVYINQGGHIVFGTLIASTFIGATSAYLSHRFFTPLAIFAYPAVIPMVPGVYAYKAILGIFKILYFPTSSFTLWRETFQYGVLAFFIFAALALGVTTTSVLLARSSFHRLS